MYIFLCMYIYIHTFVYVYIYVCVCIYTWEELVSKEFSEIWNHAAPFPFFLQQFHSLIQFPVCIIPTTNMNRLSRKLQLFNGKI